MANSSKSSAVSAGNSAGVSIRSHRMCTRSMNDHGMSHGKIYPEVVSASVVGSSSVVENPMKQQKKKPHTLRSQRPRRGKNC